MGLITCDDCGKERSDQIDSACPNCGSVLESNFENNPAGEWLGCFQTLIAIFVSLCVIAFAIMTLMNS